MIALPKRRHRNKGPKQGRGPIRCPGHLQFLRGHNCILFGTRGHACWGKTEAHHVKTRGAGGGDDGAIPVCSAAHRMIHDLGIQTFEKRYVTDLNAIAERLWAISPHRLKYERSRGDMPELREEGKV